MKTYKEFRPTGCDTAGLGLPEQQDWFVGPVTVDRDSNILAESNWEVVKNDLLENFPNDVEVHEFGHWACGWFRILLIRPDSEACQSAERWESALADYPVASEDDYSDRCAEAIYEYWSNMTLRERVALLGKLGINIFAARREEIPDRAWSALSDIVASN